MQARQHYYRGFAHDQKMGLGRIAVNCGVPDLPIRFELAQCIHGPDRRRNPSNQKHLQDKTNQACKWASDGEEGQERQENREQQSHLSTEWKEGWGAAGIIFEG